MHLFLVILPPHGKYINEVKDLKCLVCGKEFNEKRYLTDLFRTKKYYICMKCIKEHPIELNYNNIPLDSHMLEIISLFKKEEYINYDGYFYEYSSIYQKLLEIKKEEQLIMCDSFVLNEETIEKYNYISKTLDKDIVILTNVLK